MARRPETRPLMHVSPEDFQLAMQHLGIKNGTALSSFLGFEGPRRGQQLWKDPAGITEEQYETILRRAQEAAETQAPYFLLHWAEIEKAEGQIERSAGAVKGLGENSEVLGRWFEFRWTMQTLDVDAETYVQQEADRQELIDRCLCDGYRLLPEHGRDALWGKLDGLLEDLHSEEGERIREWIRAARLSRARSSELLESIDDERFECEDTVETQNDRE